MLFTLSENPKTTVLGGTLVAIACLVALALPSTPAVGIVALVVLALGIFEIVAGCGNLQDAKATEALAVGSAERRQAIEDAVYIF